MKEKSKQYRAWEADRRVMEADRKVFLYPANWLDPDLREDKTPFFKELENEILSGEDTAESVEKAVSNYLKKLNPSFHGNPHVYSLRLKSPCKYNYN